MAVFLGVDGGGTKTAFVLVTDRGDVLESVEGPSSYHLEHGFAQVTRVLSEGVADLFARSGITADDVDFGFFALPGYGESSGDMARLDALPGLVLGHRRYHCDNDMVAGWAGSLAGADGINVIAGTGSMTYGERNGVGNRVGGWGELFGDEGSAYWIALQGLTTFSRMSDGRVPRSRLYDSVREALGVERDLDVIDVVFSKWHRSRTRIASLAPAVVGAAVAGDAAAQSIVDRAVDHLVALVVATRENLGFVAGEAVPVSYSGGVFRAETVLTAFVERLAAQSADFALRTPVFSSHIGAAIHAAKLAGSPLSSEALARLRGATAQ